MDNNFQLKRICDLKGTFNARKPLLGENRASFGAKVVTSQVPTYIVLMSISKVTYIWLKYTYPGGWVDDFIVIILRISAQLDWY